MSKDKFARGIELLPTHGQLYGWFKRLSEPADRLLWYQRPQIQRGIIRLEPGDRSHRKPPTDHDLESQGRSNGNPQREPQSWWVGIARLLFLFRRHFGHHRRRRSARQVGLLAIGDEAAKAKKMSDARNHSTPVPAVKLPTARAGTKQAFLIDVLMAPQGATMAAIVAATQWLAHYADVRIMPT